MVITRRPHMPTKFSVEERERNDMRLIYTSKRSMIRFKTQINYAYPAYFRSKSQNLTARNSYYENMIDTRCILRDCLIRPAR